MSFTVLVLVVGGALAAYGLWIRRGGARDD